MAKRRSFLTSLLGQAILFGSGGGIPEPEFDSWLLRDDLNTGSVAAGTRTATHAGSVVITDGSTAFSIDTDLLKAAGIGGSNNPKFVDAASRVRTKGRLTAIKIASAGNAMASQFGWASNSAGTTVVHMVNFNNGSIRVNPNFPTLDAYIHDAVYWIAIVLHTTGVYYFIRGGKWGHWNLLHMERAGTTTPLYASWLHATLTPAMRMSDFLIPDILWYPEPQVSDSFTRADGALGTSNSYEGGTNTAWADVSGTAVVASNVAAFSALGGGVGIATIEAGIENVTLVASLTRSAGNVGVIARYADSSNYIRAYHDGTNVIVAKVVAGSPTTLITKAIAYSAGADLILHLAYGEVSGTYNNVHLSTTPAAFTDAAILTPTKVGIYSTDTGNTVDNFVALPRGAEGEYDDFLGQYAQRLETQKIYIAFDGDSLTAGTLTLAESYPFVCMDTLGRANYDYCNYAVSGLTLVNLLSDDDYTVGAIAECYSESVCVLWAGTNDIAGGASAATVTANLLAYVAAQKAAGYTHVLVLTVIDRTSFDAAKDAIRATVNSDIASNAATSGYTVVDVAAFLNDATNTTYYNADGTHLKTAGYAYVAGEVATAIQAL